MYKIIFLSMANEDPIEQHNFNIFDESFNTRDEAIKFVKEELVKEDVIGFIDGDEEIEQTHRFELDEYPSGNDYEISHAVYYKRYDELIYINYYKIVSVEVK